MKHREDKAAALQEQISETIKTPRNQTPPDSPGPSPWPPATGEEHEALPRVTLGQWSGASPTSAAHKASARRPGPGPGPGPVSLSPLPLPRPCGTGAQDEVQPFFRTQHPLNQAWGCLLSLVYFEVHEELAA